VPNSRRRYLFRHGFLVSRWPLYQLGANDIELYLSDLQRLLLSRLNGDYAYVLTNRLLFFHAFGGYFRTPKLHVLQDEAEGRLRFSEEWEHAARLDADASLFVAAAPLMADARGASGVFTLEKGRFRGAGQAGALGELHALVQGWAKAARSPYLFVENVPEGSFERRIGASASLHVLVARVEASWRPSIVGAVLRIGTKASGPAGRIEAGGLSALVEDASGRILRCVQLARYRGLTEIERHPDSGAPIVGLEAPGWAAIKSQLEKLFEQSSYLRVAGFDFSLADDGPILLGAAVPDVASIQVHKPLLANADFAELLKRQKL
jgi:hypothetical protein